MPAVVVLMWNGDLKRETRIGLKSQNRTVPTASTNRLGLTHLLNIS